MPSLKWIWLSDACPLHWKRPLLCNRLGIAYNPLVLLVYARGIGKGTACSKDSWLQRHLYVLHIHLQGVGFQDVSSVLGVELVVEVLVLFRLCVCVSDFCLNVKGAEQRIGLRRGEAKGVLFCVVLKQAQAARQRFFCG